MSDSKRQELVNSPKSENIPLVPVFSEVRLSTFKLYVTLKGLQQAPSACFTKCEYSNGNLELSQVTQDYFIIKINLLKINDSQ